MEYPKVRHKKGCESVLVNSAEEEQTLGAGWGDTPDYEAPEKPTKPAKSEVK